jgi:hypothetical protein
MDIISANEILSVSSSERIAPNHRFWVREVAGAFGDIGTFIPILIGLVHYVGMDAATILVFAGLMHMVTGLVFGIPIAVQPMKAIAALAIAGELTSAEVSVAGFSVAVCLLILALTGGIRCLDRIIPRVLNSAIQLAVASKLAVKGLAVMGISIQTAGPGLHGIVLAVVMLFALVAIIRLPQYRQYIILGLVVAGFAWAGLSRPALWHTGALSVWRPKIIELETSALSGIWKGGFAQLPLTLLNSVFAVTLLAAQLFPSHGKHVTTTKVAWSVGLMNLAALPFGAMPMCHGSGGLAAQHACGARTGGSMLVLGMIKLSLGLLCGTVAVQWLHAFPESMMAVFFIIAAWTLAKASRFWSSRSGLVCAMVTVAVYWISGWLPLGFALGWCTHILLTRTTVSVRGSASNPTEKE